MKALLAVLLALISTPALADPTSIFKSIKRLTPSLADETATEYSQTIADLSVKYNVEWKIAVVIFKQESNFDVKAVNYESRDFGIGQMNYRTILDRKIDLGLLLTDSDYAMEETFRLLSEIKTKYGKLDKKRGRQWFTRYHSYVTSNREEYEETLTKHLKKVNEVIRNERKQTPKNPNQELQGNVGRGPGEVVSTGEGSLYNRPEVPSRDYR
jgi:hypothetical protein